MAKARPDLVERVAALIEQRAMADAGTPVLLMVSGGSDSTALAYVAAALRDRGALGQLAMLHVNHKLRGAASDGDAAFVAGLAQHLGIPLFSCDIDIPRLLEDGGNMEAVAREQRYAAASDALRSLCQHAGANLQDGRVMTAHTADDRVENFYMRSIVGTGPGGFRSMDHVMMLNGMRVCRPLLESGRDELREFILGLPAAEAGEGKPAFAAYEPCPGTRWREDATNAVPDHFRTFVRHEIIPLAKQRNPRLLETLTRTMNQIADEDDMLAASTRSWVVANVAPLGQAPAEGFLIQPGLADEELPMQRRIIYYLLRMMLPVEERVQGESVAAVLACLGRSGAVDNIQHDLAVSYNKLGLRLEPMADFRVRRKRL